MSQYIATFEYATHERVADGAAIMYTHSPYPSMFFDYPEYLGRCLEDTVGTPGIACTCDGVLVGALTLSEPVRDASYPGTGVVVLSVVLHPDHPKAIRVMYSALNKRLHEIGAQWYHTTARISATEYRSKFRRVHG